MRPLKKYVGVTGFMTRDEVLSAEESFRCAGGMLKERDLMVGVLVSAKTLRGTSNKYPRRYPEVESIRHIWASAMGLLNLVHYCSDTPPTADDLLNLNQVAGPLCHGFQFNGAWPAPDDLKVLLDSRADTRVVLQCRQLADTTALRLYRGLATDCLIDFSGGRGLSVDRIELARMLPVVREEAGDMLVGIAGGLDECELDGIADVLSEVSVDAEGRLRDGSDGGGNMDLGKVDMYLMKAASILCGWRPMF